MHPLIAGKEAISLERLPLSPSQRSLTSRDGGNVWSQSMRREAVQGPIDSIQCQCHGIASWHAVC
jgi:hypothetical protein